MWLSFDDQDDNVDVRRAAQNRPMIWKEMVGWEDGWILEQEKE